MTRSTKRSTASQTTTSAPAAVPLIGRPSGETGSEKTLAALMRERGGWSALTEQDHAQVTVERERERLRAIESAPWRQASLKQLVDNAYDLPRAVVADSWRDQNELLPPDLSEWQINEIAENIEYLEDDIRAAGPEATAVILRKLAAVVIIPERDDMDLAMAAYLEDLQGYPEHILIDVTKAWRRTEKFWPTIAELRKMCHEHEHSVGRLSAQLRELYRLRAIGKHPAPDLLVTTAWMKDCEADARMTAMRFDRFTPQKRIETKTQSVKRLKLVSA